MGLCNDYIRALQWQWDEGSLLGVSPTVPGQILNPKP